MTTVLNGFRIGAHLCRAPARFAASGSRGPCLMLDAGTPERQRDHLYLTELEGDPVLIHGSHGSRAAVLDQFESESM